MKRKLIVAAILLTGFVIGLVTSDLTAFGWTYYKSQSYYCHSTGASRTVVKTWRDNEVIIHLKNTEYLERLQELKLLPMHNWQECDSNERTLLGMSFTACGSPPKEYTRIRPLLLDFAKNATDDEVREFNQFVYFHSPEAIQFLEEYFDKQ